MSGTPADERDAAVISHLLASLTAEAREAWDLTPPVGSRPRSDGGSHDLVHAHLGRVARALRRTKPGIPAHAACCTLPDERGVLIAGRTGAGKSTLAAVLSARSGATIVSDDTVWLSDSRAESIGAPLSVRSTSPLWGTVRDLWHADESSRLLVKPEELGLRSQLTSGPLALFLRASYEPGASAVTRLSPAETFCHLVGSLLRECTADEIDELATLAGRLSAAAITYGDVDSSLEVSQQVFDAPTNTPVRPSRLDLAEITEAGLRMDVHGLRFDNDVTIWRHAASRIVYVRDWPGGSLWETSAEEPLTAMGFLERKETRRARHASS